MRSRANRVGCACRRPIRAGSAAIWDSSWCISQRREEMDTTAPVAEEGKSSMKRIALFLLTNLAVMAVLSIVLKVFGIDRVMAQEGFNLGPLLAFSAVFGFGGAIISLLISKPVARWSTGAQVIDGSGLDSSVARRDGAAPRATGQHRHAGCSDLRRRAERLRDRRVQEFGAGCCLDRIAAIDEPGGSRGGTVRATTSPS